MYHLNIELERVITKIPESPGLSISSFFSQRVASGGPVVIVNGSQYSYDALVVLLHRAPVYIPLRLTSRCPRPISER